MYCCYNPILAICLVCESLDRIGGDNARYQLDCENISTALQSFGSKIIDNIDPKEKQIIESIFMDTDFEDRTVFRIITDYEYEELLLDFKTSALLDQLWKGKESSNCNGKVNNYSLLTCLYETTVRRLEGQQIEPSQVLRRDFVRDIDKNIREEDFSF
jgi:hypothetical protein